MNSSFNVITLPMKEHTKYKVGEKFKTPPEFSHSYRFMKFDGLTIKDIGTGWGLDLYFDYGDWEASKPSKNLFKNRKRGNYAVRTNRKNCDT